MTIALMTITVATNTVVPRMEKGGESDELLDDLGGLLLDLFRARLLPQLLFVRVRRLAHGPAASAAFPWARWWRTFARGRCSGGTRARHDWARNGCRGYECSQHAHAAGERSFSVQFRYPDGVPGLVWGYGISAHALLGPLGRLWIAGLSYQRTGWRKHCVLVPEQGVDLGRREYGPRGLRNGGGVGSSLQFNPRRRDRRDHLYADGNAASVRGPR